MSAFPKADIQSLRIGVDLNVRLWPKAAVRQHCLTATLAPKPDVRMIYFGDEAKVTSRPRADIQSVHFKAEYSALLQDDS